MPTNEQRREAAKRKLERRLARQAERERRRKQFAIAGSALGIVVVVAAGVGIYFVTKGDDSKNASASTPASSTPPMPPAAAPPTAKPKPATVNCDYPDSGQAAKPVTKPNGANISTTVDPKVSLDTSQGKIGLSLDAGKSPCAVNSFVNLVHQKYFDNTPCHRLTTGAGLQVLQCGDPTGKGDGGPGYSFANEYPTDQYAPGDPAVQSTPVEYKRGVIAMANRGPDTNGSQFFLVYGDSQLPPQYTIFGTIDSGGLKALDAIGKAGTANPGAGDGPPKQPVTIKTAQLA
ncbi:MAG: peptidylprolyl isomerase [Nocardia sp.]|nr:peptidylprolyl isomerase [Nocardia sp.]